MEQSEVLFTASCGKFNSRIATVTREQKENVTYAKYAYIFK